MAAAKVIFYLQFKAADAKKLRLNRAKQAFCST
jgi:hypothetical protein